MVQRASDGDDVTQCLACTLKDPNLREVVHTLKLVQRYTMSQLVHVISKVEQKLGEPSSFATTPTVFM